MSDLFNKLKIRLLDNYKSIISLSSSIEKNVPNIKSKAGELEWGQKVMELQALNVSFLEKAEIIKEDLGIDLSEVSKEVKEYYDLYKLLILPNTDTDTEEIKKIKEYIQTIKN